MNSTTFIDHKIKSSIVNHIASLSCVAKVINYSSSGNSIKKARLNYQSDLDLFIQTKNGVRLSNLKEFLLYLKNRHQKIVEHDFLILPEELSQYIEYFGIYPLNSKLNKKECSPFHRTISHYEWGVLSYIANLAHKETNIEKKTLSSVFKNLYFCEKLLKVKKKTKHQQLFKSKNPLNLLKIKLSTVSSIINFELGVPSKNSLFLLTQKKGLGKILFTKNQKLDIFFNEIIKSKILPMNWIEFADFMIDDNSINYKESNSSQEIKERKIFYTKWINFINKNHLQDIAAFPRPYYFSSSHLLSIFERLPSFIR